MSEYIFLCGHGFLPKKAAEIAKKHGAELVNYQDGQCTCGYGCGQDECPESRRHWFAGPNIGDPFDSDLSDAVRRDLVAAKILTPEGD